MFVILLVVLSIIVIIHLSIRYSREGRILNKIAGPPGLPIIGNVLYFANLSPELTWNRLREMARKYKPVGKIWFANFALVASLNPDDLSIMFQDKNNLNKGHMYNHLSIWVKEGLITSKKEKWRHRRKLLTPAFHPNILKKYIEITQEQAEKFIDDLSLQGDESVQDLLPLVSNLTINIICATAMGVDPQAVANDIKEYKKAVADFFVYVMHRSFKPYIFNWMLKFMGLKKVEDDCLRRLRYFTDKIIEERRKVHKINKKQSLENFVDEMDDNNTALGNQNRIAMLDLLLMLEDQKLIDEDGIREEVDTFTSAGYDTTASALSFILLLLAENKDAQDLARSEARALYNRCHGQMTMNDLQSLDYIDRCIKESLRIFPSIGQISRSIDKDLHLNSCTVPVGSEFAILIYDIHRNPDIWPDPLKFDPDRFLPENWKKCHPCSFVPFSAGPRQCIGKTFAMLELKACLVHILNHFYLEPVMATKDIHFRLSIVLEPAETLRLKFVKINKK